LKETGEVKIFPHTTRIEVAFRDIDAMGHVNNAVYLSYLETARIKFMTTLQHVGHLRELPIILAEATVRYLSPALFGETLLIGTGVSRLGNKSFDMLHEIVVENGRLIATARSVLVMYDYTSEQTFPIPDNFRQQLVAMQEGWQPPVW